MYYLVEESETKRRVLNWKIIEDGIAYKYPGMSFQEAVEKASALSKWWQNDIGIYEDSINGSKFIAVFKGRGDK